MTSLLSPRQDVSNRGKFLKHLQEAGHLKGGQYNRIRQGYIDYSIILKKILNHFSIST
jgi:hypothetical protein